MTTTPQDFVLPFLKKEQVATDTFAFYFDRRGFEFDFTAGQYIRMTLPIDNPDPRGTSRFFTIASSPLEKSYVRVVTKVIQSTFKNTLAGLQPGEKVHFFGPVGQFILRENDGSYIFLVGGIGITPVLSIAPFVDAQKLKAQLTVFISFSTPEEVIMKDQLEEITKQNPNIKVIYTITHPEESKSTWNGEAGRISEELIKKYVQDPLKPHYYVVGPPKMVDAMVEIAKGMGVENEKIVKENFIGY